MAATGGCLCGGVRFRIDTDPETLEICHCRQCRKAQGGPFVVVAPVAAADFQLIKGSELMRAFASSPGKERLFCSRCGAPILSRRADRPAWVRVRAGSLDEPVAARPVSHAHFASKAEWWEIGDDLPQHPRSRP